MVYSTYETSRTEVVAEQGHLALLLINKLKQEYSEICGFVRAQMSLVIVRSNTLLLHGAREKESYI